MKEQGYSPASSSNWLCWLAPWQAVFPVQGCGCAVAVLPVSIYVSIETHSLDVCLPPSLWRGSLQVPSVTSSMPTCLTLISKDNRKAMGFHSCKDTGIQFKHCLLPALCGPLQPAVAHSELPGRQWKGGMQNCNMQHPFIFSFNFHSKIKKGFLPF